MIVVIALFCAALVILSCIPSPVISDRRMMLVRALFPSWRFYEDLVEVPVLYYRYSEQAGEFCEWREVLQSPKRSLFFLFLNPEGTTAHAANSLLHQVVDELQSVDEDAPEQFMESVSYQLLEQLVQVSLEDVAIPENADFQFKLSLRMQGEVAPNDDVLISPVYETASD